MAKQTASLFLVEGTVRLQPTVPGHNVVQSSQTRLVWAKDYLEASEKFKVYFTNLNNEEAIYEVVNMISSEAID